MYKIKMLVFVLLAALFVLSLQGMAICQEAEEINEKSEDRTLSPYFMIEKGDNTTVDLFPLKDTQVKTNINGVIADIFVTQSYSNEGTEPINATYVFPASTRVSVHGMKMTIGNQVVTAKIKERETAKQEFESAKNEGKSASLLEQQRPNVFTMSVANIMPKDVVNIELHYTELINITDGVYEFVYPTVTGPRYSNQSEQEAPKTDKWVKSPYLKEGTTSKSMFHIGINITAGVPILDLTCSSHQVKVDQENESLAKVYLSDNEEFSGNRDFILKYRLGGTEIESGLMLYQGEKENFFMLTVQPPERVKPENIPSREYIFVVDVSGSMYGYPLDTAKTLLINLVSQLRKTDQFNVILFAGSSNKMASTSLAANEKNIQKALELIDKQEGGGGTELLPALKEAVSLPSHKDFARSIIIITDGFVSVEKEAFELISNHQNKTSFFSFGIGSSVNRYLIEGIAKIGMGESFVVTENKDTAITAQRFKEYIESPVLTNINVQYDGFSVYDVEPTSIPCLFAKRPIVLFGKWKGDIVGSIHLSGKTGSDEYKRTIKVSEIQPQETNSALSYLWARTRVARLSDYGTSGNDEDNIAEITSIGLNYSMLTPFTSFIAVTETIRNVDGQSTDVNQPLPLPLNVSNFAIGSGYHSTDEPEILIIAAIILLILPLIILYRKKKHIIG